MMWSRHWVSTCGDVIGDRLLLDEGAQELVFVSLAAGKPTSISLKPILTSIWKNSSFSSRLMGTIRA